MSMGTLVMPWTAHPASGTGLVRRAFDPAYRIGDLTFASYSWDQLIHKMLLAGRSSHRGTNGCENGLAFAKRGRFGLVIELCSTQLALIRTLRGFDADFGS